MKTFAFIGTGQCEPQDDILKIVAVVGVLVGWAVIFKIVHIILISSHSLGFRLFFVSVLLLVALIASLALGAFVHLGADCATGRVTFTK